MTSSSQSNSRRGEDGAASSASSLAHPFSPHYRAESNSNLPQLTGLIGLAGPRSNPKPLFHTRHTRSTQHPGPIVPHYSFARMADVNFIIQVQRMRRANNPAAACLCIARYTSRCPMAQRASEHVTSSILSAEPSNDKPSFVGVSHVALLAPATCQAAARR